MDTGVGSIVGSGVVVGGAGVAVGDRVGVTWGVGDGPLVGSCVGEAVASAVGLCSTTDVAVPDGVGVFCGLLPQDNAVMATSTASTGSPGRRLRNNGSMFDARQSRRKSPDEHVT